MSECISSMTKQESDTIQLLRLPLTLLVVFIHFQILTHSERAGLADNKILFSSLFQMTHLERLVAFKYVFSAILARVAVPAFFLLSGYLMCHDMQRFSLKVYTEKIKRRRITLLYPYILWNVLTVAPVILIALSKKASIPTWLVSNYSFETIDRIFGLSFSTCPIDYPLWFCRDLIVLTLLVPFLRLCVANKKWYILLFFATVYMVFPDLYFGPVKTSSVFFYALGMYLSINGKSILVQGAMGKYILVISSVVLFALNLVYNHTTLQKHIFLPAFVLTAMFLLFLLVSKLSDSSAVSFWMSNAKASFFVYACHVEFILPLFGIFREKILLDVFWLRCLFYLFVPIATLCIGMMYYGIVNKFTPRLGRLLSGDR